VSASFAFPAADDPVRALLASPEVRRRVIGYGTALALHAALLAALLTLPPAVIREADRIGQALEMRFYTVAGGPDAETDAPLFEPPLAGGETGSGPVGVDGGAGSEDGEVAQPEAPVAASEPEPETIAEPEPIDVPVPEVDSLADLAPADAPNPADAAIIQTQPEQAAAAPPSDRAADAAPS
jgi:hypothetical protein